MTRLVIDVLNRDGDLQGPGPITTALDFRYTRRLNAAGDFVFTVPKRDDRTDLIYSTLGPKAALITAYWDNVAEFTGIVERVRTTVDNQNNIMLEVSGRDMLGELAELPVGFLDLSNSGSGVTNGPSQILGAANTYLGLHPWGFDTTDGYSTTTATLYAKFAGESALQALIKVAEHIGERFRVSTSEMRELVWLRADEPASGVRAIQGAGDPVAAESNESICFILNLSENTDGFDIVNIVYPHGSGTGDTRLDLSATTRTASGDYSLSKAQNYIANTASIAALTTYSGVFKQFKDIRPVGNTDADVQAAANALYDAAYAWLQRHDTADTLKSYDLAVANLPAGVNVGEMIRVIYDDAAYAIDDDFFIIEISTQLGADAGKASALKVAYVDTPPASDASIVASDMEEGTVFSAHPQMNANSYRENFRVYVGEDQTSEKAEIRWWFGPEVVQLQQVLLRFNLTPLVAAATTVGGSVGSTGSSSETTTDGGGGSSPTSGTGDHTHPINIPAGTIVNNVGLDSNDNVVNDGSVVGSLVSLTESGGHTHTVTISSHDHGMAHTHDIDVGSALSTDFGINREDVADTFAISDLEYRVNGGSWAALSGATSHGSDWYSVDITSDVYNATTFRPSQEANLVEVRRASAGATGKTAMLDGSLEIRNIIQAIAYS